MMGCDSAAAGSFDDQEVRTAVYLQLAVYPVRTATYTVLTAMYTVRTSTYTVPAAIYLER